MINGAKYVCIEGVDGCGKTTLTYNLGRRHLDRFEYSFFASEPQHTLYRNLLKNINNDFTPMEAEYVLQADRVCNLTKLSEFTKDKGRGIILQDRGILSGIAYSCARGLPQNVSYDLSHMTAKACGFRGIRNVYDIVILLDSGGKSIYQTYEDGLTKGVDMAVVWDYMLKHSDVFRTVIVDVVGKSETEVCEIVEDIIINK
jgi:deoxyadenosine/deoxycytidine kinase